MAKSSEKSEKVETPVESAPEAQASPRAKRKAIELDNSNVVSVYANYCRITGTPEELIIDYALNSNPLAVPDKPLKVNQQIITNFYTAKRMLAALQIAIQRHESGFGVLEVDVRKRLKPRDKA